MSSGQRGFPALADYARENGKITAYDPNWRPSLWGSRAEGIAAMSSLVGKADIMKVSEAELTLLSEKDDMADGAAELPGQGAKLVVATLGARGCAAYTPAFSLHRNTYNTEIQDTTGSDDSFFSALLAKIVLSDCRIDDLPKNNAFPCDMNKNT